MTVMTRKITPLSLYAFALICCMLAIIMLLIPFSVTLEETIYAAPPGGYRSEISSDASYYSKTFFGYIDYLNFQGWSPTEEILLVVSLIVASLVSITLVVLEIIPAITKRLLPDKASKIVILSLSVFSLISLILSIAIQANVSTWKYCGRETIYLKNYPGWNIYKETLVRGSVIMIPVIIFMFIAFSAQLSAGLLKFLSKEHIEDNASQCSDNTEINNEDAQNHAENELQSNNLTEKLIKYKKLLDDGVITQEDFDAKKKQILNL